MSITVNGTNGLTFNDGSAQNTAATGFGFKNRILNGAMMIDQRNAGASVTPAADAYTVDRWCAGMTQASKMTFQQSSTAPTGFKTSLSVAVASAPTVGASDWFGFFQKVEGFNSADLGFGAAGASTVTISFWVRSSVTGVYGGSLMNSAQNRSYPYTYTVNAANTWEQKTVTIAGDTTGTWVGATNGTGLLLIWSLGAGSSFLGTANAWGTTNALGTTGQQNWVTNAGATFYITGVQLEKGSTATAYDYRPYGTELALCQRYYEKSFPQNVAPAHNCGYVVFISTGGSAGCGGNTYWAIQYKVTKRTDCTIRTYDPTGTGSAASNLFRIYNACNSGAQGSTIGFSTACDSYFSGYTQYATDVTTGFQWTAECEL